MNISYEIYYRQCNILLTVIIYIICVKYLSDDILLKYNILWMFDIMDIQYYGCLILLKYNILWMFDIHNIQYY